MNIKSLLFATFLAATATATRPLLAWETLPDGGTSIQRVWLGDSSTLYIGTRIPASVSSATNFTVDEARPDLLYIATDDDSSPSLPNPTFLMANTTANTITPVHSAVGLTHDHVYLWGGNLGFWFPRTRDSTLPGGSYLVPTSDTEGTYEVRWFTDTSVAEAVGGKGVSLATWGNPN